MLIALRALQATGGAGFTPSATGIIVDHFGDARDRAVSLFGSIFPIGAMIGPIFGGLFVSYLTWRAALLIAQGIAAIMMSLAIALGAAAYRPSVADLCRRHDHCVWYVSSCSETRLRRSTIYLAGGFGIPDRRRHGDD